MVMAWTNFVLLIGFLVGGFVGGRLSVSNRVKFLENQTSYDLDVSLDEHGVLVISE